MSSSIDHSSPSNTRTWFLAPIPEERKLRGDAPEFIPLALQQDPFEARLWPNYAQETAWECHVGMSGFPGYIPIEMSVPWVPDYGYDYPVMGTSQPVEELNSEGSVEEDQVYGRHYGPTLQEPRPYFALDYCNDIFSNSSNLAVQNNSTSWAGPPYLQQDGDDCVENDGSVQSTSWTEPVARQLFDWTKPTGKENDRDGKKTKPRYERTAFQRNKLQKDVDRYCRESDELQKHIAKYQKENDGLKKMVEELERTTEAAMQELVEVMKQRDAAIQERDTAIKAQDGLPQEQEVSIQEVDIVDTNPAEQVDIVDMDLKQKLDTTNIEEGRDNGLPQVETTGSNHDSQNGEYLDTTNVEYEDQEMRQIGDTDTEFAEEVNTIETDPANQIDTTGTAKESEDVRQVKAVDVDHMNQVDVTDAQQVDQGEKQLGLADLPLTERNNARPFATAGTDQGGQEKEPADDLELAHDVDSTSIIEPEGQGVQPVDTSGTEYEGQNVQQIHTIDLIEPSVQHFSQVDTFGAEHPCEVSPKVGTTIAELGGQNLPTVDVVGTKLEGGDREAGVGVAATACKETN